MLPLWPLESSTVVVFWSIGNTPYKQTFLCSVIEFPNITTWPLPSGRHPTSPQRSKCHET